MHRDFYVYLVGRFASGASMTLLRAALAWHVFDLTRSAFHLGLIGLLQFLPIFVLSPVGGAVADSFDRRRVINAAQLVLLSCAGTLCWTTHTGTLSLPLLYSLAVTIAAAGAFESPSRVALLPALVDRERFPRAVTVVSTAQALAFATGPATAGLVIAAAGIVSAYAVYLGLLAVAFFAVVSLRAGGRSHGGSALSVRAIAEGIAFVWRSPVVLGCMTLDMFAVIFGGATALLPLYAEEILRVGPTGYGFLTSSFEIGALVMSFLLVSRPPVKRAGRTLLATIVVFGAATIVFGFSRVFPLSLAAYCIAGMADQVSVVMRATAVQLATPDALRGRVSAINLMFIGASNQLGAAESGFVAHLTSPTFSVVSGGVGCLFVVAFVAWRLPELRRYTTG